MNRCWGLDLGSGILPVVPPCLNKQKTYALEIAQNGKPFTFHRGYALNKDMLQKDMLQNIGCESCLFFKYYNNVKYNLCQLISSHRFGII